ncbi:hypothetical protein J1605_013559 [Eschrichtius robustus]|uniref:Kelch domain-containing protein 1 n=1 Tax=Eschrichtius robustus TaxID=9764 RepID=A0AB34GH49_ESCRO|nr:hypothetical protein J1605_013559 [Eschrichtius robustus]
MDQKSTEPLDKARLPGRASARRSRTGAAFPPISTLDAFRSCVEEPGGRKGRSVGRGLQRAERLGPATARMADSQLFCVAEERSGHCAVVDGNFLYVWGGYVSIEDNEVYLPNDEIWTYEIDSGLWTMHLMEGELPTSMSGSCGACINGKLYVFGGYDDKGYSNRLYFVNLRTRDGTYVWEKLTNFEGQPPTPRDKLSCWVYKDRLIYFGGYGCRRHNELQDCFDVHDASWVTAVAIADIHLLLGTSTRTIHSSVWLLYESEKSRYSGVGITMFTYLTQRHRVGFNQKLKVVFHRSHEPRIRVQFSEIRAISLADVFWLVFFMKMQTRMNDLHYLNLDTWTWSGRIPINGENPKHRSWHTLTPIADDTLFLFGGLSADNIPLSDGWIHNVLTNCWKQLTHLPKTKPRLWHTACLGKENEIMVFGGSKDDLLSLDTVRKFHI